MTKNTFDRQYEEDRLKQVLFEIQQQLEIEKQFLNRQKSTVMTERKMLWDDGPRNVYSFDDALKLSQQVNELQNLEVALENSHRLIAKLEKMLLSPYFGRIDFLENGTNKPEEIYIGISSLIDKEKGNLLVYDWRAPICSMFYDFPLGSAHYQCQAGVISGKILLKRQYKIENGQLIYMFESSIKIDDQILQEILSKHSNEKMKTIVSSIQSEQNRVIRDDHHQVLFVQGAAGSGKTSIALHRAAYYLYKDHGKITSKNILIFSPNRIFKDYISNVLPELGEENILCTTFQDFTRKLLPNQLKIEDFNDQLEFILTIKKEDQYRIDNIHYKTTPDFYQVIKNYIQYLTQQGKPFSDLLFLEKNILSKEQLQELYEESFSYLPKKKRLLQIQRRAYFLLRPHAKQRLQYYLKLFAGDRSIVNEKELKARSRLAVKEELEPVKDQIKSWTRFDSLELYKDLFSDQDLFYKMAEGTLLPSNIDKIRSETIKNLNRGWVGCEDLAPLLFFWGKIEGFPKFPDLKHLIIDEAQDYTFLQYEVIKELFPAASFTILGDLNQAIHPVQYQNTFENIKEVFAQKKPGLFRLSKSYRSTKEIADFTKALLENDETTEYINRPGIKPLITKVKEESLLPKAITNQIQELKKEGMTSIAVIAKTSRQCRKLYQQLKYLTKIRLITNDDELFSTGVIIIPSYLAKGLEFDAVLIYNANRENYYLKNEKKLFYTACTRALHRLYLYYSEQLSPFVTSLDPELYNHQFYLE
jgi:DNA helicase-2/ATP-dependent DNA helicase PcrA